MGPEAVTTCRAGEVEQLNQATSVRAVSNRVG